jgi:hypothetical protein
MKLQNWHYFISSDFDSNNALTPSNNIYKEHLKCPLIFYEESSAVQNGGNNLLIQEGEKLVFFGVLNLDVGGIQLIGSTVSFVQGSTCETDLEELIGPLLEANGAIPKQLIEVES